MEVVDEARDLVRAQMRGRLQILRAKTRRLEKLDGESKVRALEPVKESKEEQKRTLHVRRGSSHRRPLVLAFSFRRRRRVPQLDADGSVCGAVFQRRGTPVANPSHSLERSTAWLPWPSAPKPPPRLRRSFSEDSEDKPEEGARLLVSRASTWEMLGYSGLLGNETRDSVKSLEEFGGLDDECPTLARASTLLQEEVNHGAASKEIAGEDEDKMARRISSDEHAKWRSSFNRFRHDGEIHRDDLNKALAHCGFDDRRPSLIVEACAQVTHYAGLSREEFMQFVCLYESRLHELYHREFLKYERSPGAMSVESLPELLAELGLEPRRVVLSELLEEVNIDRRELLEFRDVAAVMELLRAREGFLVAELERFRRVFSDFDSDESGDMSTTELGSALSWLGFPYTNEKVQSLYKQSDMNGNGVLSESEFVICLRHIQDAELGTIRQFLRAKDGHVSCVREVEALLIKLGYQSSAAALLDAMQEARLCSKMDPDQLESLMEMEIRMDIDDVCMLLHCLRTREGFTDAQMNDLRKAFQRNKLDDTDRIPTSVLHKVLRWLGHCYSFDRALQLIYEVDSCDDHLDFTTFVKLVRRCRNFDRSAALTAFHQADARGRGSLQLSEQLEALEKLGLAEHHPQDDKEITLERFMIRVLRYHDDRLAFLRKKFCFTIGEYENLRFYFNRCDKEGNGTLKRHELARLVETLFPQQAHTPEFRPVLVKLFKEAAPSAVDLSSLLVMTRRIQDETDVYQCSVYSKTLRELNFNLKEAAEFLSVFLPITDEGTRPVTCEEVLGLFRGAFDLHENECHLLEGIFNQVLEERGAVDGLSFLDFMLVMRKVIDHGVGHLF